VLTAGAQTTVHLSISSLPTYHPANSDVYVAGSFNGWNPQDKNYQFRRDVNGHYFIDLQLGDGKYEYKITRGGWDKAECKKGGGFAVNRVLVVPGTTQVELSVEEWADRFGDKPRVSTAGKHVRVIDTAFVMPQLNRVRRIWIYLPDGYENAAARYPVMYMHDGQNLFDDVTSFSGEWGVDECLDTMKKKCIVVGVDNGGLKRMNEYCPYNMERFGAGEGDAYVDFLAKTLKPYIDQHYRTLGDKAHTFIAGSSMGGLISMYAVLKYPDIYGGAGIFSPAFWIAPKIFDEIKARGSQVESRLYFYCGGKEGGPMVPDMQKAFELMKTVSRSVSTELVREEGQHNEARWKQEFPLFYSWLLN
jgi:predicted alpha/beta superfamily hydrolase